MTQPANLRINTRAPFPAMVKGLGPITVTKLAGLWIVGFAAQLLGIQNPPANFGADLAVVWDPIAKTLILTPLAGLIIPTARLQRSITTNAGGINSLPIVGTDSILNLNNVADLAPVVPLAATRNGAPLTFKNLPGSHVQTLTRTAPDTFDGVNTLALDAGSSITLVPYNDGVNAGYAIE